MRKAERLKTIMAAEGVAVETNTQGFNRGRYESVELLYNYEDLKDEARAIKEDAIERLPELIEQLRETIEDNGGRLCLADDEAPSHIVAPAIHKSRESIADLFN